MREEVKVCNHSHLNLWLTEPVAHPPDHVNTPPHIVFTPLLAMFRFWLALNSVQSQVRVTAAGCNKVQHTALRQGLVVMYILKVVKASGQG